MKYYVIAVFLAIAIIVAVTSMWIIWEIDLSAYITDLAVGLTLTIPSIFIWAYAMERKQKRRISKVSKKEEQRLFDAFERQQQQKEIDSLDYEFDDDKSTEK